MLSAYTIPIKGAIFIFPFLALLFTVPYVIYQYHKYGSFLALRACIVYSFILYMTCAYFQTILPLPPIAEVAEYTTPTMDLEVFGAWRDFWENTSLVLSDPSTYLTALGEQVFYEPVLNILLLLPLGVYLRYYFRRSWLQTIVIGFCVSLCFELTQLSALFGIYPRPYRLFQVDDLINNTFGALLGFWLTPLFSFFLPSRERMDEVSYQRGLKVSFARRLVACAFDWAILAGIIHLMSRVFKTPLLVQIIGLDNESAILFYVVLVFFYFVVVSWITGGRTVGKMLVNIRLVSFSGGRRAGRKKPSFFQYLIRYSMEYYLIVPAPFIEMRIYDMMVGGTRFPLGFLVAVGIVFGLIFAFYIFQIFIGFMTGATRTINEVLSKTSNVSGTRNKERRRG
ncbi:MAG: VanZ family protein [Eubacterium sp.]|nr:VanZ family protein [Eubacterium sp.]